MCHFYELTHCSFSPQQKLHAKSAYLATSSSATWTTFECHFIGCKKTRKTAINLRSEHERRMNADARKLPSKVLCSGVSFPSWDKFL